MAKGKGLEKTALVLAGVAAVNWGILGVFNIDLVGQLTGGFPAMVNMIIAGAVGVAGILVLAMLRKKK